MKNLNLFICKNILLAFLVLPLVATAQNESKMQKESKIAYIQESVILDNVKEYKKQMKDIDSLQKSFSEDVKVKTENLNTKLKSLLSSYAVNNDDTIESITSKLKDGDKEKFALYMEENKLLENYSKNYDNILKTKYDQNIKPMINELNLLIKNYAKSNNISVVYKLESLNVAYIDEGINITSAILKELEKK